VDAGHGRRGQRGGRGGGAGRGVSQNVGEKRNGRASQNAGGEKARYASPDKKQSSGERHLLRGATVRGIKKRGRQIRLVRGDSQKK